jgi:AcrR family transcriptional regulator
MSGVAALVQLRTSSGARLPQEVTELVASFLPTGFDLLPPLRPNRRTLAHQVEFLEDYFRTHLLGEIYAEDGSLDEYYLELFAAVEDDYMEMLEDTAISVMQLVGVRGATARATMLSIFAPPVTSSAHLARARRLANGALHEFRMHVIDNDGLFEGVETAVLVADLVYLKELMGLEVD